MLVVEGFQKFAGIPFGISRIFESLMPQQICANRRKNRSIQVKLTIKMRHQFLWVLFLFLFSNFSFALEPPTKKEIEKYKKDKTWAERVKRAKRIGNHKASPSVVANFQNQVKRMFLKSKGKTEEEINAILSPIPGWGGLPTKGQVKVLALLIEFKDYKSALSASYYDSLLFKVGGTESYLSLRDFYLQSSYNQLDITGNTLGWYTTAYPRSNVTPEDSVGRENLIKEVLEYYDSQGHDFSQYDNDNDGKIDYFIVIWAGPIQGWGSFWWGYQESFRDSYIIDGKELDLYSWQMESRSAQIVIHETGHALGLPDYYDYDNTVGPNGGVGGIDMMDGTGDHNCFSKFLLDWITPAVFSTGNNSISLRASGNYPDAAIFMPDATVDNPFYEFFMIQNRYRTGNDDLWPLPGDGFLIWHVDAQLAWTGYNFKYNNSNTDHKLLRLVQADGLEEIETGDGRADAEDYFVQGDTFGPETTPSSDRYDGTSTQVGVQNISSPAVSMNCEIFGPPGSPTISLDRTKLNVGSEIHGNTTNSLYFSITNPGEGTLNWSISDDQNWMACTPTSGTASGNIIVSIDPSGLAAGTYNGAIAVSAPKASNSPQTVAVTLNVYNSGQTSIPFGEYSTPLDGSTVRSSVPFTGWVLDDLGVQSVTLYRKNGSSSVYIGDAVFVEGARPDVELAYPDYPMNYKAGWGYMMLTNFLPDSGNGTFTIDAIATDIEGHQVTLGSKTIYCDNVNAVKPFGAIDTPSQGGSASGSSFTNWGWVLTPQPNSIPTDGSTLNVYVDGVNLGHPTYNIYRSDIAALLPGYANSQGAIGYFTLDTTAYENGVHTIQWTARDSGGNSDGIGSRYFTIQNTGDSRSASGAAYKGKSLDMSKILSLPLDLLEPIKAKKGFHNNAKYELLNYHNKIPEIELDELGRLELQVSSGGCIIAGYMMSGPKLYSLPVGSTLKNGIFSWSPGPGFFKKYHLLFLIKDINGNMKRKDILVNIVARYKLEK